MARARTVKTTISDLAAVRAPDLVRWNFTPTRPGQLQVADFTYVPLDGGGFGYTALIIDAFTGLIAGWECSSSKEAAFVQRAICQAAALRRPAGPPAGRRDSSSDAGSQYTSLRFAEILHLAGLQPSIGTVGDSTAPWPRRRWEGSPFRTGQVATPAELEDITSAWVHWYNTSRLMHRLGRRPPSEAESEYYARHNDSRPAAVLT